MLAYTPRTLNPNPDMGPWLRVNVPIKALMGDEFVKLPTCAGQLSSELQPLTTIALVRVTAAVATVLTDKIMTKSNSTSARKP